MSNKFRAAVMRAVAPSVSKGQSLEGGAQPQYQLVQQDWQHYHDELCKVLGRENVFVIPADDAMPDCMFIEDTAVVAGNTVLITQLGHPTRRGESRAVREFFKHHFPDIHLVSMVEQDPIAYMDGGDILFTGHEFFVGQSGRTNMRGLKVLQATFPQIPVHPVTVQGVLHLKSAVTMATEDRIVAVDSDIGRACMLAIMSTSTRSYGVVYVPEAPAANVVNVNGTLFVPGDCHRSIDCLKEALLTVPNAPVHAVVPLDCSEARKIDGAISCTAVLIPAKQDISVSL